MKSQVEVLTGLKRKISVEVPLDKVKSEFARAYSDLQRKVEMPGFRKGKVPINVIAQKYKDQVTPDVIDGLVRGGLVQAFQEHRLDPVSTPDIHFEKFEPDAGFEFSAQFEVRPDIQVEKTEKLPVLKERLNITDERVDKVLDNIRESRMEHVPIMEERPAQEGDVAVIDFKGFVDGQPLPGGEAENYKLDLGSNSLIEGFEEGVVGMKPGQKKNLPLAFPESYHAKEVAGKPVNFEVTLLRLERKEMPELNDEFVASLGTEQKTVGELKDRIREDMIKEEEGRIEKDVRERLLSALVEANPIEVPEALKQEQRQILEKDVEGRLKQANMSDEQVSEYKANWGEHLDKNATKLVQVGFLVDAIARDHNLYATDDDINQKIKEYGATANLDMSKLEEFYKSDENRNRLYFRLTEDKVVNFLLDKADITEVEAHQLPQED